MVTASIAKIDILGGYQGGTEPWERIKSIRIDAAGFHETHLVGYKGVGAPLDVKEVASTLTAEFESHSLLQLLEHVVSLHALIKSNYMAAK